MASVDPSSFTSFGELLKFLRQRARLTQKELGIAVGYSDAQITRLESGKRLPDPTAVRARLLDALDLREEPGLARRLIELAVIAERGTPEAAQPAPTPSPLPTKARLTNLPVQLTSFIGREREMAEVTALVSANRLMTLTGAGGVGKTRLAMEVGAALVTAAHHPQVTALHDAADEVSPLPAFSGGVWLVELAPLTDPAGVPRRVAEVLRLSGDPGRSWTDVLVEYLAGRHLLLLLDNCEHLIGACAELVEALLGACPALRVLATSRELLGLPGEVVWRVPSLTTPEHLDPPERLMGYEAVRLFATRAAEVQPGFWLSATNTAAVAHVCARLDGIPLAIEMSAAQVAAMSVQELAARLDDRFALLTSARRTALPRQRTLWATLEWSYSLLTEPERILLARLAVFADGWTAELARAACADDHLPAADVLPLLLGLVRKSLVVADTRGERTRYRMLETVRQYAAEKLTQRGETAATYRRLAAHLSQEPARERGWPVGDWHSHFLAELGNVRNVVVWARSQRDGAATILRLASMYAIMSYNLANLSEPLAWLEEGLAQGGTVPAIVRIKGILGQLTLHMFAGYNLGRWSAEADEVVAQVDQLDTVFDRSTCYLLASIAALGQGDLTKAEDLLESECVVSRQVSFGYSTGLSFVHRALLRVVQGDLDSASTFLRQAYQLGSEPELSNLPQLRLACALWVNMSEGLTQLAHELAKLQARVPSPSRVDIDLTQLRSQLARSRRSESQYVFAYGWALQLYVEALLLSGDYERAQEYAQKSLVLSRATQWVWVQGFGEAEALLELGRIAYLRGDPAAAHNYGEQCMELYRRVGDVEHLAQAHVLLGYAALAQGDVRGTEVSMRRGLALFRELQQPAGEVVALAGLAALAEVHSKTERAARLYGAADVLPQDLLLWLSWAAWTLRLASRVIYDREIAAARERYTAPALTAAWAEGRAMTLEQAVAYALQDGEADAPPGH